MVLFIMLWLPYNIIVIIAAFSGLNFIPHWLWSLSYWLCYLNSGAFMNRTFKIAAVSKLGGGLHSIFIQLRCMTFGIARYT